ncbi:16S rRNA G966 N2-methylase RsmD [Flavobacterium arsenatis]|uniref:16S rRNA G966 N2-methylase RsmD n=1 Tax=Flavobacterium arsenatis TaxID=1484332 RepID=A0ABU1TTJ6_9FLAO|nr:hypothetical protein [Flavobacterium arsenatis]MDR6969175.1 16S rRNA G966 N2-methylase RsmD [Flavobacterium arsenatis]
MMKVKKITGTRDAVRIEFEDAKILLLTGELTITPEFYADIFSIIKWDPPFENEIITEDIKKQIIKSVEDYNKSTEIPIIFD